MAPAVFSLDSYAATHKFERRELGNAIADRLPTQDCYILLPSTRERVHVAACDSYSAAELDRFGLPKRHRFEEPFESEDPEYGFVLVNEAMVVGDTGVVLDRTGALVLESLFPADRANPFAAVTKLPEFKDCRAAAHYDEDVFLLFRGGGFNNFWHFHIDMLPVITFLKKHHLLDKVKIAVPTLRDWHRSALALLGVAEDRFIEVANRYTTFRRCALLSTIFHPAVTIPNALARQTLADMRRTFRAKRAERRDEAELYIYVARSDSSARMLVNEDDLIAALRSIGFTIVLPSQLTYDEQLEMFDRARLIVGAHGAGLTSLYVAHEHTSVVEIFPFGLLAAPHYRLLGQTLGLRYHMYVSELRPVVSPHEYWTLDVDHFMLSLIRTMAGDLIGDRDRLLRAYATELETSARGITAQTRVSFGEEEREDLYRLVGFSGRETWGSWMAERVAIVLFTFDLPASFRVTMDIECFAPSFAQPVVVECGISRHEMVHPSTTIEFEVKNPRRDRTIWLKAPGAVSPAEVTREIGADTRRLSIGIKSIRMEEVNVENAAW